MVQSYLFPDSCATASGSRVSQSASKRLWSPPPVWCKLMYLGRPPKPENIAPVIRHVNMPLCSVQPKPSEHGPYKYLVIFFTSSWDLGRAGTMCSKAPLSLEFVYLYYARSGIPDIPPNALAPFSHLVCHDAPSNPCLCHGLGLAPWAQLPGPNNQHSGPSNQLFFWH